MLRRILTCLLAAAGMFAALPAAADGPSGCGAMAPVSPYCSSGWHVFDESHDEAEVYGEVYTGTLQSTIRYPDGEWIYTCDLVGGVQRACQYLGRKPALGTVVYHTCDSYHLPVLYGGSGSMPAS